jgi:uncharacterized protein YraI
MKKLALLLVLLSLLSGTLISADGVGQQLSIPLLVVNTSFLNARSGPGPQYTVITTLVGGTELPVLGTNSDDTWYLVTTAAGNAWVDVSFTLPRGVFDYVPEIQVAAAAPVALTTPLTIGLPGSVPASAGGGQAAVGTLGSERYRAVLRVTSANVLNQPLANGGVITTLYINDTVDYPVLNTTSSSGLQWVQIAVPNIGVGWIEGTKVAVRLSGARYSVVTVTSGPVNLLAGTNTMAYPPLFNGEEAFLINAQGDLYQVELSNGVVGWLPANRVTIRTGTLTDQQRGGATAPGWVNSTVLPMPILQAGHVVVNTGYLNVRSGPGGQFSELAVVAGGAELPVVGVTPDALWFLVRGSFGQGWVSQEFVLFRGVFSAIPVINY